MSMHVDPRRIAQFGEQWWYRHVCAVGGVFNMLAMFAANLVGFVIGTGGISYMIGQLTDSWDGTRSVERNTTHRANFSKLDFSLRHPICVLGMFLSVRRRTDDVRIQVRSVLNASQ